ncbi:MAG TPA: Wzz/FepE/Etk N-terminal domain-containing protein [Kineosporiaceae bacterium]|nr:Wzz/FepE/Etk N-terminal domain-containing protein [Kineosporiaceae bacterium]
MELRDYLRILRLRWRSVVSSTVLALAAALVYSLAAPPVYVAQSTVFLSVSVGQASGQLSRGFAYAQSLAVLYSRVASEPVVLDPVIKDLGLPLTAAQLSRSVVAQTPRDSVLIQIQVSQSDPRLAARIANSVAGQLTSAVDELLPKSATPATGSGRIPVRLTAVAPAAVPTAPTSPRLGLNLAFGLALGFAAGGALALLRDSLSGRIDRRDVAEATRAPVIAMLGGGFGGPAGLSPSRLLPSRLLPSRLRSGARPGTDREATAAQRERGSDIHQLRAGFEHLRALHGLRTVALVPAGDGDCAAAVAARLARSLARAGVGVLLVDGDVRRPVLGQRFGLPDGPGVAGVLQGRTTSKVAVARFGGRAPAVLPAGERPADPSTVLADGVVAELLRETATEYDVVLVKAPPPLRVADGLLLAATADATLLVVDQRSTRRTQLTESLQALQLAGARLLGVVLSA